MSLDAFRGCKICRSDRVQERTLPNCAELFALRFHSVGTPTTGGRQGVSQSAGTRHRSCFAEPLVEALFCYVRYQAEGPPSPFALRRDEGGCAVCSREER